MWYPAIDEGFSHQESGLWENFPGEGKWFLGSLGGKKVLAQGWERQEGALFSDAFLVLIMCTKSFVLLLNDNKILPTGHHTNCGITFYLRHV